MTANANIQGIFRLTSPLHVATTDTWGLDESGRPVPWKTTKNLAATMRQRIMVNGQRYSIPYFPANDIRGRLRRMAASIVLDALHAQGITVPVAVYSGLKTGAPDGQPESGLSVEEAVRGKKHVYLGLFGGGKRMLKSNFSTRDLLPILKSTVEAGMVPDGFGPYAHSELPSKLVPVEGKDPGEYERDFIRDGMAMTDIRHWVRLDDLERVSRPDEIRRVITDWEQSVAANQAANLENKAKVSASKNGGEAQAKSTLANIGSLQSVVAGTDLFVRLDMADSLTDAQVGLLVSSLLAIVNEQGIGGYSRVGFGHFDCMDFRLTAAGEDVPLFEQTEPGVYALTKDVCNRYVAAMRDELANETLENISSFFLPSVDAVKALSKKGASAA